MSEPIITGPGDFKAAYIACKRERNEAMELLAEGLGWIRDDDYGYPFGDHTLVTLAEHVRNALIGRRANAKTKAGPIPTQATNGVQNGAQTQ